MIKKVQYILPIIWELNVQCIGKKGGYKNYWKIPMAKNRINLELYNIYFQEKKKEIRNQNQE